MSKQNKSILLVVQSSTSNETESYSRKTGSTRYTQSQHTDGTGTQHNKMSSRKRFEQESHGSYYYLKMRP